MIARDIDYSGIEGAVDALYANARSYNPFCIALSVTKESNMPLWLAARRRTTGSSSGAAALGVSQYVTPFGQFLEDSGQVQPKDISHLPAVKAGIRNEGTVRDWFAEETNRRVDVVNAILVSKAHPFIHACPDGRVVGEAAGLECKTAGYFAGLSEEWGPSGSTESDAVPLSYLTQCMISMIVTGWRTWYLAVLIGGNDFRWYTIKYDAELAEQIVAGLKAYRARVDAAHAYVLAGKLVPESLAPSMQTMTDVYRRWPKSEPTPIAATREIADLVDEFAKLKRTAKANAERLDEIKLAITTYMGACDTLVWPTPDGGDIPLATHRSSKRTSFDTKLHAKERPDCHCEYVGPFDVAEHARLQPECYEKYAHDGGFDVKLHAHEESACHKKFLGELSRRFLLKDEAG